ncbi:MAG: FAD:protein FMN transferase [Solirubrobacteraceae bacterium]
MVPERSPFRAAQTSPESASFEAFGSLAVVAVADVAALEPALEAVQRVVAEFDLACSRFRPDSGLSAVNASGGAWTEVSPLLLEAVSVSLRAAEVTDGDVDPTVGQALVSLGYDRDFAEIGGGAPARPRLARVPGWRTVQLDPEAGAVRVPRGVTLDLGATAKALAADHAAAAAGEAAAGADPVAGCADTAAAGADPAAGCGVLVSLGGDLAITGPAPAQGWSIRVTDDHRADLSAPGQWITLRSGGLATSSTTVRRWKNVNGEAHHLVDPATGRPVSGSWRTATVTAASCLDANIASTAAMIRGARAAEWLESLALPARLVTVNGTVRHVAGWPEDGEDLPRAASRLDESP